MGTKLLIAFDDSENAMRAVANVARSFSADAHVTLFHVAMDSKALCRMNSPGLTPYFKSEQSAFCTLEDKKRELVEAAFQQAKKILNDAGFDGDRIKTRNEQVKHGVARDILFEASSGYDIIVLGRRGVSGVKEFLFGGTAQKVIHGAKDLSVFIAN